MTYNEQSVAIVISAPKNQPPHPDWLHLQTDVSSQLQDTCRLRTDTFSDLVYVADGEASTIYHNAEGWDLAGNDLVISRWEGAESEKAVSMAYYLQMKNIRFMNRYLLAPGVGKLASAFALTTQGVSVPTTFHASPEITLDLFTSTPPLEYPFIYKADVASRGRNNFLIHSSDDLARAVERTEHLDMIAQAYVPNVGELRVIILNGKAEIVQHWPTQPGTHLNKSSQDPKPTLLPVRDINPVIIADSEKAAAILNLDVASVDIGIDAETGKHYLFEVNRTPNLANGEPFPAHMTAAYSDMIKSVLRSL